MTKLWLALATFICLAFSVAAASAAGRVALVIGNSAYERAGVLANPKNDAADFASALERIGFTVTVALDLDGQSMRSAMRSFRNAAVGAEMAVVYFAGHGIEIDRQNYLIPVDANLESDSDVLYEAIPLNLVEEAVAGATRLRMVLLDACRNNPFLSSMQMATPGRSIARGLAPVEPVGGTLIAFAAKSGTVALDGTERNSPFMRGLLANLEQPGLDVMLLMRKVRDSVLAETANRQEPFVYGSLPGHEVYLVPPIEVAALPSPVTEPIADTAEVADEAAEFAWRLVENSGSIEELREFILLHPRSARVAEALELLLQLSTRPAGTLETNGRRTSDPQVRTDADSSTTVAAVTQTRPPAAPLTLATPTVATVAAPESEGTELTRAIQAELERLGCEPGATDGVWTRTSRVALSAFSRDSGVRLIRRIPTEVLLDVLKRQQGTVCAPRQTYAIEGLCHDHYGDTFLSGGEHRAFTISSDGYCGWALGFNTPDAAEARALSECESRTERAGSCVLHDSQ